MQNLSVALKAYPQTLGLIEGRVTAPGLAFTFHQLEPIHRAFRPMAQSQAFDVSEMAVFTFLQAYVAKKPIVLLPLVLAARFQHGCLVYNRKFNASLTPDMLAGKRIGVRAWSQTTGAWVRNILVKEHGIALDSIKWVTFEGGHLDEFSDPAYASRAPHDTDVLSMLMSGQIDAAILGNDLPDDPDVAPVIPNSKKAGAEVFARNGLVPINHMLAVTQSLADRDPGAVRAIYEAFVAAKQMAPPSAPDIRPMGFEAVSPSLQHVLDLALEQKLIPHRLTLDEIFGAARSILA